MLIDELINAAIMNLPDSNLEKFRRRLRAAMKFELSPDFAAAAEALAANFSNVAKAIPFCRLPFKSCWIEVVQRDRPRFFTAGIHIPELQTTPKRIGFLMEAMDERLASFRAHQFWNFPDKTKEPNISELAMRYDPERMRADPNYVDRTPKDRYFKLDSSPMWKQSTPEVKSMLESVISPDPPDFLTSWGHAAYMGNEALSKFSYEVSVTDWSGEAVYLLAVLALLNTRNAHEISRVDMSKVNKGRKARGVKELQDYHLLKIHPRVRARMVRSGASGGAVDLAHHIVRGHWKVRATGVFWWNPFWRGDPTKGRVSKGYVVD